MKLKVIHGAPCSGKTTYVRNHIKENDMVYDYDELTKALTFNEEKKADKGITHPFVIDFRLSLLKRIKTEEIEGTCYFIVTELTPAFLKYIDDYDHEIYEVKASKEECLERLEKDDTRKDKEKWKRKIEEYFKKKEDEGMNKKQRKKLSDGREYRSMVVQVRSAGTDENEDMIVEGYATTFNQPYLLWETSHRKVYEKVSPNAFDECDMSDVIFQYDHDGRVFARTRNKTLELSVDDKGLFVRANLGGTDEGRKLYQEIKGGYTDKMSFGFVVEGEEINHVEDLDNDVVTITRTITKVSKLYDVSAVSIPANDMTTISARNFCDGVMAEIESERTKRARLKLKIKLMED